ncbi:MAG: hypothetical protein IPG94_15145 [Kineosporiaceae bacterium]|nr:hypothetical protein [Kineosporiaceae bacterium]
MRSRRTRPATPVQPAPDVEWLTPAPDGSHVELAWPEADGPYTLTCHLARVDGRTMLVGLDIRSFTLDADGEPVPGTGGLVEVNHPALRSLRAGEIAEAARATLAVLLATKATSRALSKDARQAAARTLETLTAPSRPGALSRPAGSQLEKVAGLFNQAVAAGGDSARRPSIYVHQALVEEGQDVSLNTVRGQIHRARVKGLIPLAP